MKKHINAILLLLFPIMVFAQVENGAQKSKAEQEFEILKGQYEKLLEKEVEIEKQRNDIIKELKEERKNHQDFVENIYLWGSAFVGFIVTVLGIFFMILNFRTKSDLEKILNERKKELQKEAEKKLEDETNRLVVETSRIIGANPSAMKNLIHERISDFEAKQNNSICLVYSGANEMKSIKHQLLAYGFNDISEKQFDKLERINDEFINSINSDVTFFVDTTERIVDVDKDGKKQGSELCIYFSSNKGILEGKVFFYLGSGFFPQDEKKWIVNFAKTRTTMYQNLLDLLRYLEFRKKNIGPTN